MTKLLLSLILALSVSALSAAQDVRYQELPVHDGGIIFAGDSITDDCEWNELFGNQDILNRGIDGNDSAALLARSGEFVRHHPSKLFIAIGTNDLPRRPVDEVVSNVEAIIGLFRAQSPETEIYVQSVLPVGPEPMFIPSDSRTKNRLIIELNRAYEDMCARLGLVYIDLHSHFLGSDGEYLDPELASDDLHLKGEAYLLWKDLISEYVNE